MAGPGEHSTVQPVVESGGRERLPAPTALDCPLEGKWFNATTGLGQSTITIATQPDGRNKATEQGLGYFEGSAEVRGRVIEIIFRRGDGSAGYYEWTLDADCTKGDGKLVFTAVSKGQHPSTIKRLP